MSDDLTEWILASLNPVRVGWYEFWSVRQPIESVRRMYWNGWFWSWSDNASKTTFVAHANDRWRGLKNPAG